MSMYLQHHGIPGQKWGIRRFQNEDGSYTPEGKERYGRASESRGKMGSSGMTGRMSIPDPATIAVTSLAIRHAQYRARKAHAKKEIAKAHINDEKERITKDNIHEMARLYNKKERKLIIDKMKDNPRMTFDKAKQDAADHRDQRALKNTLAFLAAQVAIPLAFVYGPKIRNKVHDSLGRNKAFQEFLRSLKHMKMKDAIVLRKDEYEIDKQWKLSS